MDNSFVKFCYKGAQRKAVVIWYRKWVQKEIVLKIKEIIACCMIMGIVY